jgi:hypothetical protein
MRVSSVIVMHLTSRVKYRIGDICSFIKSVAPNQLVGLGYEGFYGPGAGGLNPADWASREGQNYVANSEIPCIDYVSLHGALYSSLQGSICC